MDRRGFSKMNSPTEKLCLDTVEVGLKNKQTNKQKANKTTIENLFQSSLT